MGSAVAQTGLQFPLFKSIEWSRRRELNSRPADYELSQNPAEATQEDSRPPKIKDLENE